MRTPWIGDKEIAGLEFYVLVFMVKVAGAGKDVAGLKKIVPMNVIARQLCELNSGNFAQQKLIRHVVHEKRENRLAEKVNSLADRAIPKRGDVAIFERTRQTKEPKPPYEQTK